MTNPEISELLALLQGTNITVFEMEREGLRIRIEKPAYQASAGMKLVAREPLADHHSSEGFRQQAPVPPDKESSRNVTSPIVGTFYRSPSPDAGPYVEIGATVRKGQVLCIIEAMKLMNEIESEFDGIVKAILVEDGRAVEFGTPLIEIAITPENG
ncbi:MAG: acetyl-CoA carboxylase biotin carboxyl carrier protein [Leptospirillum sp.]|jgi:acetyl-CoA carboxylase biotin carboxyl carrier protein|nr:acetyl-CoA carboxylase biotin carboxyl carrier protein [Nitrospiraceae bacterium]